MLSHTGATKPRNSDEMAHCAVAGGQRGVRVHCAPAPETHAPSPPTVSAITNKRKRTFARMFSGFLQTATSLGAKCWRVRPTSTGRKVTLAICQATWSAQRFGAPCPPEELLASAPDASDVLDFLLVVFSLLSWLDDAIVFALFWRHSWQLFGAATAPYCR